MSGFIFDVAVTAVGAQLPMHQLPEKGQVFTNFGYTRAAADVTFRQTYRPNGSLHEGKKYFSEKHKLCGYKVELFVLPNGLALGCSVKYLDSIPDLKIIQEDHEFHSIELKKTRNERQELDSGELREEYPRTHG